MSLRHIIVEGPDGSGKSTLIKHLMNGLPGKWELAPRASTSIGGPVKDLTDWTIADLRNMPTYEPRIYDRHPVISEPIYGRICRGKPIGPFLDDEFWVKMFREYLAQRALVIWCLPPLELVREQLNMADQMPGVVDNIAHIYGEYRQSAARWPGTYVPYNRLMLPLHQLIQWVTTVMENDHVA